MDVFPSGHDQGRSTIAVTGDIDLGTAEDLLVRLTALIGSLRHEISLDLSGVTFIDCSGLRTLTAIDFQARANGADIRLTAVSPAVARLFELVYAIRGTSAPAAAPTAAGEPTSVATGRTAAPEQTDAPPVRPHTGLTWNSDTRRHPVGPIFKPVAGAFGLTGSNIPPSSTSAPGPAASRINPRPRRS